MKNLIINKAIAVLLTVIMIAGIIPFSGYAQDFPSTLGEVKGFNQSVFDSHFSRADREYNPDRWLAEAKWGITQAVYAWELIASSLYEDPEVIKEARNKIEKWSNEELEARFTKWLIGRFFGEAVEKAVSEFSAMLSETQKNYSWQLDEEGNVIFDDKTGDPLIIRPGEENREFSTDLIMWRGDAKELVNINSNSFENSLARLYPELLAYIPEESRDSMKNIIYDTGKTLNNIIKSEFENIAAREERIFTSLRTRDILSLRKKSDDEAARIFTEKLISETELLCSKGIDEINVRIEQAYAGEGDLAILGEEWLQLYKEQFERGLKAWEEAEERFFIRRIEWELESENLLSEGIDIWLAAFNTFEEQRKKWELDAKNLLESGERIFNDISEEFEKSVAAAKAEFEINMNNRVDAGTTKAKALVDMYITCASAAISAKDNVQFWLAEYGNYEKSASDPDFDAWLLTERMKIWEDARKNIQNTQASQLSKLNTAKNDALDEYERKKKFFDGPFQTLIAQEAWQKYIEARDAYIDYYNKNNNDKKFLPEIQEILAGNMSLEEEIAFEKRIRNNTHFLWEITKHYSDLNEARKSYELYVSYIEKATDARERLITDFTELFGTGALKDILDPDASSEDFCLDEYQIALIRAKTLALYWERKTDIAEAVMEYASAIDAGRITDAEGVQAWENAKAAYNSAISSYEYEIGVLNGIGVNIQEQQIILDNLARELSEAERQLENLNRDYSAFITNSAHNKKQLKALYDLLVTEYSYLFDYGDSAGYKNVLEYGAKWAAAIQAENIDEILSIISLEELFGKDPRIIFAERSLVNGSISSGADWYANVREIDLTEEEKSALFGKNLYNRLVEDYEISLSILLERRLEYEISGLMDSLDLEPEFEDIQYLLNIFSGLQERLKSGEGYYTDDLEDNQTIEWFLLGNSLFKDWELHLSEYISDYNFSMGLLNVYCNYRVYSNFVQKENYQDTFNLLNNLFKEYDIETTDTLLPDVRSLCDNLLNIPGDFVFNTADFFIKFDNCFSMLPAWFEIELDNWKIGLMEYIASYALYDNKQPAVAVSVINEEPLYSYMYFITSVWENYEADFNEAINSAIKGKHWREFISKNYLDTETFSFTYAFSYKEGLMLDALDIAIWNNNRLTDAFYLYSNNEIDISDDDSDFSQDDYLDMLSEIERKLVSINNLKNSFSAFGRRYDISGLSDNETQMELIHGLLLAQEEFYDNKKDEYFSKAEEFINIGNLYDAQYRILKNAYENAEVQRHELEVQDAIRRWASTAYLDADIIDIDNCREKMERAQTVLDVLSSLYNKETLRSYDNPGYNRLYNEYEQSFTRKLNIMNARDAVSTELEKEINYNIYLYNEYINNINYFGQIDSKYNGYKTESETKKWKIKDIITVNNGILSFSYNNTNEWKLSGIDDAKASELDLFFKKEKIADSEKYEISLYEEAVTALVKRMEGYFTDDKKIKNWGYAREYVIYMLKTNNNIDSLKDLYLGDGVLREGGDLGVLKVQQNLLNEPVELHTIVSEYIARGQSIWNNLSDQEKADLEFYIILTIDGYGYHEGFSQVPLLKYYQDAYDKVKGYYDHAKEQSENILNPVFFLYGDMIKINNDTKNKIKVKVNATKTKVNSWVSELKENYKDIIYYEEAYNNSNIKIADLKGIQKEGQSAAWNDISKALELTGKFNNEDLITLKAYWDAMLEELEQNEISLVFNSVPRALEVLTQWAEALEARNNNDLKSFWVNDKNNQLNNENNYFDAQNDFIAGLISFGELYSSAENAYGNGAPAWKTHYSNMQNVLLEDLLQYLTCDTNYIEEFTAISNEILSLAANVYGNRYLAELTARETEWNLIRKDIADKKNEWQETVDHLLEFGRADWNNGLERMKEAFTQWQINFQNEYNRVSNEWNEAYLAGLEDKEKWLEQVASAANQASSDSYLSLIGAEGERLARFVDTREPFGIRNSEVEADILMTELLKASGISNMANAIKSINNNFSGSPSYIVKSGLGGISTWDSNFIKVSASDLARTTNKEIAEMEAKAMARNAHNQANAAISSIYNRIDSENTGFMKFMDDLFVFNGLWRKSGNNYQKDIIMGSTLIDPVMTQRKTVEGYRKYTIEPIELKSNIDESFLARLDFIAIIDLLDDVFSEVKEIMDAIFRQGDESKENKIEFYDYVGDELTIKKDVKLDNRGKFYNHIGDEPTTKKNMKLDNGINTKRSDVFEKNGSGEMGRLKKEFMYWSIIDNIGSAEISIAPWDKRIWNDNDSFFKAPTLRQGGQIAGAIVAGIVTCGTGFVATIGAMVAIAAISSASDIMYNTLDTVFGYKSLDEAAFETSKTFAINAASSLMGGAFSGFNSASSIGSVVIKTSAAATQTVFSGITTSILNGITYDSQSKSLGFSSDIMTAGMKSTLTNAAVSAMGAFTTSTLSAINSGAKIVGSSNAVNLEYLKKFNEFAGSLVGQGINYALGNDFTLNLFNTSLFGPNAGNTGLLELHLGRDGASMNFGTGGANVSIDNIIDSFKGLQIWDRNNNEILFAKKKNINFDAALRGLINFGDEIQQKLYWDILKGKVDIKAHSEGDFEAKRDTIEGKDTITITGYHSDMSVAEQMFYAVKLGHEAYRDTVTTNDNHLETRTAAWEHTEMAKRMIAEKKPLAINGNLMNDFVASYMGIDFFNAYVDENYDSSADYWKLMRNGTLVNDNSGWLTFEDGKPVFNVNGEQIGAKGIETGLLNILFGGTSGVGYNNYTDEQITFAQSLMISAGMNYKEGTSGDIRDRSWSGNTTGQPLNMQSVMHFAGNTVASQVFARYYENTAISMAGWLAGKDIDMSYNKVDLNVLKRFSTGLLPEVINYFGSMGGFFDASANFTVTGKHGSTTIKYEKYENDAHFGTDLANGRSGDPIYLGIPGTVILTDKDNLKIHGNGNWMVVEYGYKFEGSFIGSGIYGEYMHMETKPNFSTNSYLNSNQIIGTVGNTGRSTGPHLHYSIYTLDTYSFSLPTLQIILNNKTSNTVVSKEAKSYAGTNRNIAKKVTYDIENYLNSF
jgi:murein DD-endopeptidase MepM/ murein hydrolase activator NlpD